MSKLTEIITTQMINKHLVSKIQDIQGRLNELKGDDEYAESIKREIGSIVSFLIKQGIEIEKEMSGILVLKFIEVRLDYVAKALHEGTTKNFFYFDAGILKPITDYKVFDKEIMDNPYIIKCYEQIVEVESEDE